MCKGHFVLANPRFSHEHKALSLSLNGLRAFESAARHLSFTAAAAELGVTQSAVSHQIKALEGRLGINLFRRTPRGLAVTDEGLALAPTLTHAFDSMAIKLTQLGPNKRREPLTISVVGTFALGWLLPRLTDFEALNPFVDLRLLTNNNRVDILGERLDGAIQFGGGTWRGMEAQELIRVQMSPLCAPSIASELKEPCDLSKSTMLRSFRAQDWLTWLEAAGVGSLKVNGPIFDSSPLMAEAAARGYGVALLPIEMFRDDIKSGRLIQPIELTVPIGAYWLTHPKGRAPSLALMAFKNWLAEATRDL
jgi:LysR family transcriptional regulator, regulator of gene expression of beta-lactamase